MNCVCCGHNGSFYPIDPEHTKTRGSGGTDNSCNVSRMCRKCHQIKGTKGISYMAEKYPSYKQWLIDNNWYVCQLRKKWVNDAESGRVIKK